MSKCKLLCSGSCPRLSPIKLRYKKVVSCNVIKKKSYLKGPKYNKELATNVTRVTNVIRETARKLSVMGFKVQFKYCKTEWVKNEL